MPVVIHDIDVAPEAPGDTDSNSNSNSNSANLAPISLRTVERLVDRIEARRARLVAD